MINFIRNGYGTVVDVFLESILKELGEDEYIISTEAKDNMVNVIFFTEDSIYKNIKANKIKGINVFMTHGIADKNWRTAEKIGKFDYVFQTGDLWAEKLISQGLPSKKILINGYTRLDGIYNKRNTYEKKCKDKRTILFAPTHTSMMSTYGKYDDIIEILKKKYNVIVCPHPSNRKNSEVTGDEFLEADVICGDFGSSMYEGWTLNKPCVFGDWIMKEPICRMFKGSFEDYIYTNKIGRHANNEDEFIQLIEDAVANGITKEEVNLIDGIFNKELRGNSGKVTASHLRKLVKELQGVTNE